MTFVLTNRGRTPIEGLTTSCRGRLDFEVVPPSDTPRRLEARRDANAHLHSACPGEPQSHLPGQSRGPDPLSPCSTSATGGHALRAHGPRSSRSRGLTGVLDAARSCEGSRIESRRLTRRSTARDSACGGEELPYTATEAPEVAVRRLPQFRRVRTWHVVRQPLHHTTHPDPGHQSTEVAQGVRAPAARRWNRS